MSTPFGPTESVDSTKLEVLAGELAKHIKTEQDIAALSRQLLKLTVESALNAELETHLGYAKHAPQGRGTGNSRNGTSGKTLKGDDHRFDHRLRCAWRTLPQYFDFSWFCFVGCVMRTIRSRSCSLDERMIKAAIKNRRIFPGDRSALKVVFLAIEQAAKKWTMPVKDWKQALNRFAIQFDKRMPQ